MTLRLGNETVVAKRPLLEAGDANSVSGPGRSTVGTDKSPVELDRVVLEDTSSMNSSMSGNAVMNERATSEISVGAPPLMAIVPPGT
jgi:hypothetical protein